MAILSNQKDTIAFVEKKTLKLNLAHRDYIAVRGWSSVQYER